MPTAPYQWATRWARYYRCKPDERLLLPSAPTPNLKAEETLLRLDTEEDFVSEPCCRYHLSTTKLRLWGHWIEDEDDSMEAAPLVR